MTAVIGIASLVAAVLSWRSEMSAIKGSSGRRRKRFFVR
jgi:hypothetical protein